MSFPVTRLRRLRQTESLRSLVRETHLEPTNFIYPLFVCPGEGVRKEISSMPGVFNISVDEAVKEAREAKQLGIGGIILFGLPEKKDDVATGAWSDDGIVQRATRAIKQEVRDLTVIGDVCLCEYMSHGHCGVIKEKATQSPNKASDKPMRVNVVKSREQISAAATMLAQEAAAMLAEVAAGTEYEILNDPGDSGQDRRFTGACGNGHHRPVRHDGRPRGRHPPGSGPSRFHQHANTLLCGEIRFRFLWAFSGSR
jgi:delta-aminolevulinic acid dehydratase/porphobilinogen synthase